MTGGMATERRAGPEALEPKPKDLYRILLLRKGGSELLVASEGPPFTLPWLAIPRWQRVAENLTDAFRRRYGHSVVCLFAPEIPDPPDRRAARLYQVMETRGVRLSAPDRTSWLPLTSISDQSFADQRDLAAIRNMSRQIGEFQRGQVIGPFGRPGWIEELLGWAEHAIEPYGLRLRGDFRQLNASPTFALIRIESNGPALWFKAVGEPNLREFPISVTLAGLFPGFVPRVIATHPVWHGWLTTECAGRALEEDPEPAHWERAARTLGKLEVASMGETGKLLDAGCRDLRIGGLLALVDPFLEVIAQLMEQQHKTPPPVLSRGELLTLGAGIKEALSELSGLGVPETLGHLDFNPGNIQCSGNQCVFLDWAEACVGPPFLTFQYLLEHLSRMRIALCPAKLSDHYFSGWARQVSSSAINAAQTRMPLLAVFTYAAGSDWRVAIDRRDERLAGYLRSLTRRMQTELGVWQARSARSCVGGME